MSRLSKIFKAAKNIIVEPDGDITSRIINRLDNINSDDNKTLDDSFVNFLRKNNSRIYFFEKKLKENSGFLILFSFFASAAAAFIFLEYKNYKKNKNIS